ncbi:MAG: RNA polymerase subunit sigma-24 [Phycisphaeraceae bacterium]|nr:RNA polymerase subunit sigma-24 [Phycisphaeraceae bacterium]
MASASSRFHTTLWSVVRQAGDAANEERRRALETLCVTYWQPLYSWCRRDGKSEDEAQELVQGLFARLLDSESLTNLDPARGRFRGWLLAALKNHVVNEREHARAERRGGGRPPLPIDVRAAERTWSEEPAAEARPDDVFDRDWARTLTRGVLADLQRDEIARGRGEVFDALESWLAAPPPAGALERIADGLGMRKSAIKVALHRLRRRFSEGVRTRIAQTVAAPEDVEEELRTLIGALAEKTG